MPDPSKLPAPSIVLEWDTVQEGGMDRVQRGLREVGRQLVALAPRMDGTPEVVVCHDPSVISPHELTALLEQTLRPGPEWGGEFRLCPAGPESDYYDKKNIGALESRNGILLFFDTDLVPDAGWLEGMLAPFRDWKVSVVVGATHLDHRSTYEMAVALFWIFHPAQSPSPLRPTRRLVSNNIAFRQKVFERFPFPHRPTHRGQCTELGLQLMAAGITLYEQRGARASHPPPPGFRGFVKRAWAAGQDDHFYDAQANAAGVAGLRRHVGTDFRTAARRIRERRRQLRPPLWQHVAAWLMGWSYYTIKASAYVAALFHGASKPQLAHE